MEAHMHVNFAGHQLQCPLCCSLITIEEQRMSGDQGIVIFGHPRDDVLGFRVAAKLFAQLRLFEKEMRILGRADLQRSGIFPILIEAHRNLDNRIIAPNGWAYPPFAVTTAGESLKTLKRRQNGKFGPLIDDIAAWQVWAFRSHCQKSLACITSSLNFEDCSLRQFVLAL